MQSLGLDRDLVLKLIALAALIGAAWIADLQNRRLANSRPKLLPYIWGYFLSYCFFILAVGSLTAAVAHALSDAPRRSSDIQLFSYISIGLFLIGLGLNRRWRWAWVVGTLVTMNPILVAVNWAYCRNRWAEFGASAETAEPGHQERSQHVQTEPVLNAQFSEAQVGQPRQAISNPATTIDPFELALKEIEAGSLVRAVWARALAESGGDMNKARSLYIKLRAFGD